MAHFLLLHLRYSPKNTIKSEPLLPADISWSLQTLSLDKIMLTFCWIFLFGVFFSTTTHDKIQNQANGPFCAWTRQTRRRLRRLLPFRNRGSRPLTHTACSICVPSFRFARRFTRRMESTTAPIYPPLPYVFLADREPHCCHGQRVRHFLRVNGMHLSSSCPFCGKKGQFRPNQEQFSGRLGKWRETN